MIKKIDVRRLPGSPIIKTVAKKIVTAKQVRTPIVRKIADTIRHTVKPPVRKEIVRDTPRRNRIIDKPKENIKVFNMVPRRGSFVKKKTLPTNQKENNYPSPEKETVTPESSNASSSGGGGGGGSEPIETVTENPTVTEAGVGKNAMWVIGIVAFLAVVTYMTNDKPKEKLEGTRKKK